MRDVNIKFKAEGRKGALIINNCPDHPIVENLPQIKPVFLSPNTTPVIQPMDQVIIKWVKVHYRIRLVKLILRCLDSNKPLPKVSLLTAL